MFKRIAGILSIFVVLSFIVVGCGSDKKLQPVLRKLPGILHKLLQPHLL